MKKDMRDAWRDATLRRFRPHVGPRILSNRDTDWRSRFESLHKENVMPRGRFTARHNPILGSAIVKRASSGLAARIWIIVVSRENSRLIHQSGPVSDTPTVVGDDALAATTPE